MSTFLIAVLVLILILVSIGLIIMVVYNRLVSLKNRFKNSFSQIDVQLKRRYDLIPNIVQAAKAYMGHESQTLTDVTEARAKATSAQISLSGDPTQLGALNQLVQADGQLTSALGRLLVSMEAYPELKADQSIAAVMEEMSSTENRIAFARQAYNDSVMFYNEAREQFPAVLFAELFGFGLAEHWRLDDDNPAADPPKIQL